MKKLFLLLLAGLPALAQTPFEFRGVYLDGTPITNTITIAPWPSTNYMVGVGTNMVLYRAQTYTPDTNGYFTNSLMAGNYRLTAAGLTYGFTFGIPDTNTLQNLAQLAGTPVVTFMNFTIAQFSDAGSAAYSNATAFLWAGRTNWNVAEITNAGSAAYSNTAAFLWAGFTNWMVSQVTNAGSAAYSNANVFATNNTAGITGALGYTPPTNTAAGITGSLGYTPPTNLYALPHNNAGYATNNGLLWISTNLASGSAPNATAPDGSILTGTNGTFYIRSNSAWVLK